MRVTVLFFGQTADLAGTRSVDQPIEQGATVADTVMAVLSTFPALRGRKLLYAVNEEYVAAEAQLRDGDHLAIFTAVSGG